MKTYSELLWDYINEPANGESNFYLGYAYHQMGQTAGAVSFYLRAAERADKEILQYEALLRASMCFHQQGSRGNSVVGLLQQAISLMPRRPEAYFYLARYYEQAGKWFDGYMIASIGWKVADFYPLPKLLLPNDYPGRYGLLFEKAVCAWWTGLCNESLEIMHTLKDMKEVTGIYREAVLNNIERLEGISPRMEHGQ